MGQKQLIPDIDTLMSEGPDSVGQGDAEERDPVETISETQELEETPTVEPEAPEVVAPDNANVRLSKKRKHEALGEGLVNIGMHKGMYIPSVAAQLAGFYVEDPAILINQFPQYKWIQVKGSDRPVQ